jgi:endonuclease YncB( thermonuclease family)
MFAALLTFHGEAPAGEIVGYAFVQQDCSLDVGERLVRLFGIYVPPTDRICRTWELPVKCGPRAALALDFEIGSNFVSCAEKEENPDGSMTGTCRVDGGDLGAWMLENGWAVALPHAPSEYHALEKLARAKGLGIWGFPADSIKR